MFVNLIVEVVPFVIGILACETDQLESLVFSADVKGSARGV